MRLLGKGGNSRRFVPAVFEDERGWQWPVKKVNANSVKFANRPPKAVGTKLVSWDRIHGEARLPFVTSIPR